VGEQEVIALGNRQRIGDEIDARIVRRSHEMPQQPEIESLSDYRGYLKCVSVARAEPIHASLDQALN
jgi:hypothetical protein